MSTIKYLAMSVILVCAFIRKKKRRGTHTNIKLASGGKRVYKISLNVCALCITLNPGGRKIWEFDSMENFDCEILKVFHSIKKCKFV